jgi:hypothetical protein
MQDTHSCNVYTRLDFYTVQYILIIDVETENIRHDILETFLILKVSKGSIFPPRLTSPFSLSPQDVKVFPKTLAGLSSSPAFSFNRTLRQQSYVL